MEHFLRREEELHHKVHRDGKNAFSFFLCVLCELCVVILLFFPLSLSSLPQGGEVVSGDVVISQQNATTMHVKASDKSIVAFDRFHIGENESVKFIQPKSTSTVLVRDRALVPSQIMGRMDANGRLFLINPNGIVFGPTSQVNVGSLIASTLDIDDRDFITGNYRFKLKEKNGYIVNKGTLKGSEAIALLSPNITNVGAIIAEASRVVLAAGELVTLDFTGDGLVSFAVGGELEKAVIEHLGSITAAKGEIALYLKTADHLIKSVINIDGLEEGVKIVREGASVKIAAGSELKAPKITIEANDHIAFEGAAKGKTDLTITSTQGDVLLLGKFADKDAIQTFTVTGRNIVQNTNLRTTGPIEYHGRLFLSGNVAATNGSISFFGPVIRRGKDFATITSNGEDINFYSTLDADIPDKGLQVSAMTGSITFHKPIGSEGLLGSLFITATGTSLNDVFVAGDLNVKAKQRIDLFGSKYEAGQQSWEGCEIHPHSDVETLFSSPEGTVFFDQGAKVVLDGERHIRIVARGGKLSDLKALHGGIVSIESPDETFTVGEITGTLNLFQMNADEIILSNTIHADSIYLSSEGDISNAGHAFPLLSHGPITLVSRSGSIGSYTSPIHVEAPKGKIIVGAKGLVKLIGNSSDYILHVIHGQRPDHIIFNDSEYLDFSFETFLDAYREDETLSLMPDIARKKNPEAIDLEVLTPRSALTYYQRSK
jgi:filamentous hemagglutinin family protein